MYQYFASLQWYDPEADAYQPPNRNYIPRHGRWLTPDPIGKKAVKLDDPQTWNMYAYVRNNPTTLTDASGLLVQCSSSLNNKDAAACQAIIDTANLKDKNGNYVYKHLHDVYKRLNDDKRTFTIVNTQFGKDSPHAGRFDVRQINAARNDFASGVINLDFSKIKGMTVPSSSLIPGFKEYQGLIGKFGLELAEGFGHEGEHGVYALDHLLGAVKTQLAINDHLEMLQIHNRAAALQDAATAKPYLDATELDAQRTEQTINEELNKP